MLKCSIHYICRFPLSFKPFTDIILIFRQLLQRVGAEFSLSILEPQNQTLINRQRNNSGAKKFRIGHRWSLTQLRSSQTSRTKVVRNHNQIAGSNKKRLVSYNNPMPNYLYPLWVTTFWNPTAEHAWVSSQ